MLLMQLPITADRALTYIKKARAAGLELEPFLLATLDSALAVPTSDSAQNGEATLDGWIEEAVSRSEKISKGEEFKLQDLFTKEEWKRIPSHTTFGRDFRKSVESRQLATHVGKTTANQAIYSRAA